MTTEVRKRSGPSDGRPLTRWFWKGFPWRTYHSSASGASSWTVLSRPTWSNITAPTNERARNSRRSSVRVVSEPAEKLGSRAGRSFRCHVGLLRLSRPRFGLSNCPQVTQTGRAPSRRACGTALAPAGPSRPDTLLPVILKMR